MPKESIASQLERARRMLSVIESDAALRTRLATLGYNEAELATGQQLYETVLAARTASHSAHGDQLGATGSVDELRERVENQVSALTQMARTIFAGNDEVLETLGLRLGARATPEAGATGETSDTTTTTVTRRQKTRTQAALLDRARTLYDAALQTPDLLAALTTVGYSKTRLESERAEVAALEQADATQEGAKADAKASTASQSSALEALNDWLARLRGVARAGLRDRPDFLDKLGV